MTGSVMSTPLVERAVKKPISFARRAMSKMSGRSNGSPPERMSAGTPYCFRSSMTAHTCSKVSSPGKSTLPEMA